MRLPSRNLIVRAGLVACLIAFVLGARWFVVDRYGSDLPEWDQWVAEGQHSLVPWFAHHYTMAELFLPHNEHRVVLTKLLNLALTLANGQWDQRLECAVNPMLPALIAAGFLVMGSRAFGVRWLAPLFLLLAATFGLPIAWENIVNGFNSQQFFLIGLSFAAIASLPFAAALSGRWWLGAACAVLALGSMASWFFAAAAVICVLVVRLGRRELSWRAATPALVLCAGLVTLGLLTLVAVAGHVPLKAHTFPDFLTATFKNLQWPASASEGLALLVWMPWCLLVWQVCAGGGRGQDLGEILAGLGVWVIAQVLATAYARGVGGSGPASRYLDTLAFGQAVNGLAMLWLWHFRSQASRRSWPLAGLGLAWAAAFMIGSANQTVRSLKFDLPPMGDEYRMREQNVRSYFATGDEAYLRHGSIPFPDANALLQWIPLPELRALMPASVRPPIELKTSVKSVGFVELDSRAKREIWVAGKAVPRGDATGISPETTPLMNRVTWGSHVPGSSPSGAFWESDPVQPGSAGWLRIDVAGDAGEPGITLEVRDAQSQALVADVRPGKVPGHAWRSVYVQEPRAPYVVEARVDNPRLWLAFGEPVEMGRMTYWARWTVKGGLLVAEVAAVCAALLCLWALCGDIRERRRAVGQP